MTNVKRLVRELFEEETLTPKRLESILTDTKLIRRYHLKQLFQYTVLSLTIITLTFFSFEIYRKNTITETVLKEIATKHACRFKEEIRANSYEELAQKMKRVNYNQKKFQ